MPDLQVRFRTGWNTEMKKQEIGLGGSFSEPHPRFMQVLTALFQVAGFARDHDIGPIGFSSTRFREDMVYCQDVAGFPTILASEIITS